MIGTNKYFFIFFIFINYLGLSKTNLNDSLVKNGVEQINFLENFNKEKDIVSQKWYVYFLEKDISFLKAITNNLGDVYENIHIDNSVIDIFSEELYLKDLNNKLIEINKHNDLDVYVAFTGSRNLISIPIIPKDKKTIASKISHLDSLIRYGNLSSNNKNNLLESKNSLELYTKELKTVIKRIYEESNLVNRSSAQNIIMPFSNLTIRSVYTLEGIKQKRFWSYSLHLAKISEPFNKLHFKKVYNSLEVKNKAFGSTPHLKSISKQVLGIEMYFNNEVPTVIDSEKEACLALLEDPRYQPLLEARILSPTIRENPCILKNMGRMGPIDTTKSQWMQDTEFMIAAPLYCAILAPLAAEFLIPVAIESFGTERLTSSAVSMTVAVAVETAMLYAFTGNSEQKWNFRESLLGVNKINVVYEGVKALAKIPFAHELVLDCAFNGVDASKALSDFENYKLEWESKKCLLGVGITILTKVGLNQGGAYFKTLKDLAKNKPQVFIEGWSALLKEVGPAQKEAGIKLIGEMLEGTGIKPAQINRYINQIRNGGNDVANNVDNTADDLGNDVANNVDNTADDLANNVDNTADDLGNDVANNVDNTADDLGTDVVEAVDAVIVKLKNFDGVSEDLVNSLSIKLSKSQLDEVVEIVSRQSDDFPTNKFLDDIAKAEDSANFLSFFKKSEMVDAWKVMQNNSTLRKKVNEVLVPISRWIKDGSSIDEITESIGKSKSKKKLIKEIDDAGGVSGWKLANKVDDILKLLKGKYADDILDALKKDFPNATDLKKIVDDGLIDSWKLLDDAGYASLKTNPQSLEKLSNLLTNSKLSNSGLDSDMVSRLVKGNRNAGGSASALDDLTKGLDDLVSADVKFQDIGKLATDLEKGGNFAEGASWVQRHLTSNVSDFSGKTLVFESVERVGESVRRIDVKIPDVNGTKYLEFKSVNDVPPSNFANQFVKDMQIDDVTDLGQLEWIFDGRKISSLDNNIDDFIDALDDVEIPQTILDKLSPNGTKNGLLDAIEGRFDDIFMIK